MKALAIKLWKQKNNNLADPRKLNLKPRVGKSKNEPFPHLSIPSRLRNKHPIALEAGMKRC